MPTTGKVAWLFRPIKPFTRRPRDLRVPTADLRVLQTRSIPDIDLYTECVCVETVSGNMFAPSASMTPLRARQNPLLREHLRER